MLSIKAKRSLAQPVSAAQRERMLAAEATKQRKRAEAAQQRAEQARMAANDDPALHPAPPALEPGARAAARSASCQPDARAKLCIGRCMQSLFLRVPLAGVLSRQVCAGANGKTAGASVDGVASTGTAAAPPPGPPWAVALGPVVRPAERAAAVRMLTAVLLVWVAAIASGLAMHTGALLLVDAGAACLPGTWKALWERPPLRRTRVLCECHTCSANFTTHVARGGLRVTGSPSARVFLCVCAMLLPAVCKEYPLKPTNFC